MGKMVKVSLRDGTVLELSVSRMGIAHLRLMQLDVDCGGLQQVAYFPGGVACVVMLRELDLCHARVDELNQWGDWRSRVS